MQPRVFKWKIFIVGWEPKIMDAIVWSVVGMFKQMGMVASYLNLYENSHFKLNYEGNINHIFILQDFNGKLKFY